MKKLLFVVAIAGLTYSCNDDSKSSATSTTDTTKTAPAPVPADSSTAKTVPALKEGLMTMKDGKMMIVKDGAWAALEAPVTCTNGRKVAVNGEVSKGDKKRKLEEGMMIDKDGQMMDKDGKAMDNTGWE